MEIIEVMKDLVKAIIISDADPKKKRKNAKYICSTTNERTSTTAVQEKELKP